MRKELSELLINLESEIASISYHGEYLIADRIKELIRKDQGVAMDNHEIAEHIAFDFLANYPNNNSQWNTYYGPQFVFQDESGLSREYPSIQTVNAEIIDYWISRAKNSTNPIFKSRYADLVVDFYPQILNSRADIDFFQIVIDANCTIVNMNLADSLDCITKIERALDLSLKNNDRLRIDRCKVATIRLHKSIAINEKPGTWGFAFQWFLLEYKNKIKLTNEETDYLIKDMEERLKEISFSPYLVESAVSLLAEYYANLKDEENLLRVLEILIKSFKNDERSNSEPLLITSSYQNIVEILEKYNGFTKVNSLAKEIKKEIGNLNLDWSKSMKTISVRTEVPKTQIDDFIKSIFENVKIGVEFKDIAPVIGLKFLPRKQNVEESFKSTTSKSPIQFLVTTQVISDDGIPLAILPPLDVDQESHFARHFNQRVQLDSFFLSIALDEVKARFSADTIISYLSNSILFINENKEYLKRSINAYWSEDYIVSSHLFIPIIETAIRELIKTGGGVILKPNRLGGYDRILLDGLLDNIEIFTSVFDDLGNDVIYYLKLVLSHKLGLNLRNDFAHGIGKEKYFHRNASDRLFHVLLALSAVKLLNHS